MKNKVQSVKDLLIELKETSEMMIDLAFLALLYNHKPLSEEILRLEESFDELHTEFELKVLELNKEGNKEGILGLVRIGYAAENLADAASNIAEIVLRLKHTHPIVKSALEESEEIVELAVVKKGSWSEGMSVEDVEEESSMNIIAIKRGEKWKYRPEPDFHLAAGDLIIGIGFIENKGSLETLCSESEKLEVSESSS
ncbi:MAG TPA: hypothetical protein ENF41_00925 [Candidatus Bathyarchaeota archaeon]|nr:hypothetical protein [Candidatus Bathyarchaeota archaeon]